MYVSTITWDTSIGRIPVKRAICDESFARIRYRTIRDDGLSSVSVLQVLHGTRTKEEGKTFFWVARPKASVYQQRILHCLKYNAVVLFGSIRSNLFSMEIRKQLGVRRNLSDSNAGLVIRTVLDAPFSRLDRGLDADGNRFPTKRCILKVHRGGPTIRLAFKIPPTIGFVERNRGKGRMI